MPRAHLDCHRAPFCLSGPFPSLIGPARGPPVGWAFLPVCPRWGPSGSRETTMAAMEGTGLLDGQVAVVTGGGAGIGGAAGRRLAAAGATVVLNDIEPALLASAVAEIEGAGGSAVAVA